MTKEEKLRRIADMKKRLIEVTGRIIVADKEAENKASLEDIPESDDENCTDN